MTESLEPAPDSPDRNLALELVRVTEAAALAAARWVGRGDKDGADGVAVDAMRQMIATVQMRGVVVIGEGEKDNAPMLFNGEEVGDGTGPEGDVAVDPIDGTTLTAKGMNNAVSVLAVAPAVDVRPSAVFTGEARHGSSRGRGRHPASVAENVHAVAKAGLPPEDVTVDARPSPPREACRRGPRDRRGSSSSSTRRGRCDHGGAPQHRNRHAARHRRHAGGHHPPPVP